MDGLYLLWWVQEKQMSPALVAATMAAGDLLLMGLEVPTGWFADKFGNRRSLILGSLIQVAGMICCWLADGIPGLVLACLLVAVGDAFRSGADQALLYRSCVELNREGEFQKIEARSRAVHVVALAALIVAGGAIVSRWGFSVGWIAQTLLCATGGLIAYAMVEPPSQASAEEDDSTAGSDL
jgi:MFS family permease